MNESTPPDERVTTEERARIRHRIRERGMTFEVFLPGELAEWLRAQLAAGVFTDAGEAGFVAFQDLRALSEHPEARRALLDGMLDAALRDPRASTPLAAVRTEHETYLRELARESARPPHVSHEQATIANLAEDPRYAAVYAEEVARDGTLEEMRLALTRLSRALTAHA